jgi:hypothetical protein
MGIRRWLSGTLRPDDVETDSITADSATVNGTTDTDALEADDQTINNSVTYPDGTTVTTSPSGSPTFSSGDFIGFQYLKKARTGGATISTTSYTAFESLDRSKGFSIGQLPNNISAYAKIIAKAESPSSGETLDISFRVEPIDRDSTTDVTEVSVTFDGNFKTKESAWQEITSLSSGFYNPRDYIARVSGGSASTSSVLPTQVIIGYRVD